MSYLLSEIALEMLGYKFYDPDGVCSQPNFRNVRARQINEDSIEPNLEAIVLGRVETNAKRSTNTNNATEEQQMVGNRELNSTQAQTIPADASVLSKSGKYDAAKVNIPSALSKLLDFEMVKLREQLQHNKEQYTLAKRMEPNMETLTQEFLEPFYISEKDKLRAETKNLQHFRKLVESNLVTLNQNFYDKYLRTFEYSDMVLRQVKVTNKKRN